MNSWKVTGFWFMLVLWLSASAASQPALFGVQATRAARSRPLRLESFLPADALAVALVDNVAGLKAALSKTDFYRLASEKSPGDPMVLLRSRPRRGRAFPQNVLVCA
jgi:hypothetical protein